jgi:putative N-acetylmannosamine-6-phosphate epimerase
MIETSMDPKQPVHLAKLPELLKGLQVDLMVSWQSSSDEPQYESETIPYIATIAAEGGLVGIRYNTIKNVIGISQVVTAPIINTSKKDLLGYTVCASIDQLGHEAVSHLSHLSKVKMKYQNCFTDRYDPSSIPWL